MKKQVLSILLVTLMMVSAFLLASCDFLFPVEPPVDGEDEAYRAIYQLYVENAANNGQTPDSYEDWLDSIRGEDGQDGKDGADGAPGKDGVSPNIGYNGNWWIGTVDTGVSALPQNGTDGKDGVGIANIEKISTEDLVDTYEITYTNGSKFTFTITNGSNGVDGEDGKDGVDGKPGQNGTNGTDGKDGATGNTPMLRITDGYWEVSYDNGETWISLGVKAVGEKGDKGDQGVPGKDGADGKDGEDGKDGANGAPGKDGVDGKDGQDGVGIVKVEKISSEGLIDTYEITYTDGTKATFTITNGANGTDGEDGKAGVDGAPGKDGIPGKDGVDGTPGKDGADGVGISSAEINADGELVLYFTDGTSLNLGKVVGSDGKDGVDGKPGQDGEDLTACEHEFGDWTVDLEPTCSSIGVNYRSCSKCGEVEHDYTQNIDHKLVDVYTIVNTCSQHTVMTKCSVCNAVFVDDREIGANHSFGDWYKVSELTCVTDGEIRRDCTYCDCYETKITIGEHKAIIDDAISPTCTKTGLTEGSHCSTCGEVLVEQNVVDALGHTTAVDVAIPATCTEDGKTEGSHCAVCLVVLVEQQIIPAYHQYSNGYETNYRYHWHECEYCDSITDKEKHILGTDGKCTVCDVPAEPTTGISYKLSSDGTYAIVDSYVGTDTIVKIADQYMGVPVTKIDNKAFYNCDSITNVIIPDSVTYIGDETFCGCSGLVDLNLPDGIINVGYRAFYGCSKLITTEKNVSYIRSGDNPYAVLTHVETKYATTYEIHEDTKVIAADAFYDCDSLRSILIPEGVQAISEDAFMHCDSLSGIMIPDSVIYIGPYTFYCCVNLKSAIIGSGVTTINAYTFYGCKNLLSVSISDSVTSIGSFAFASCSSLTSVVIPDSVTSIGSYAFASCSSLTSVVIGDSVTSIGSEAFSNCSSLTSVVIPDSVTSIGSNAFRYCSSLTSVVIGDSVTSIGDRAFYECSSLTSVVIGDSVTSIGYEAFWACSMLTNVYYTGTEEEWESINIGSSNGSLTNATIHYNYVPEE